MLGKPIDFVSVDGGTVYTINNRTAANIGMMTAPYYFICVDNVDGLWGADISYESHPIPNAIGEKSGDVFRRGKSIALSGQIYGRGLAELYEGSRYLQHMFAELGLRKLRFTLWNDNFQTYLNAKVNQDLVIVESFDSRSFKWPWTIGLRADDPRTYKASDNSLYPTWQV